MVNIDMGDTKEKINTVKKARKNIKKDKDVFKKFVKLFLQLEKPNIIIKIKNMKFVVDADPEVYSKEDIKRLQNIVNCLSKEIIFDRTYVSFKGNRWKDSFIVEEKWYEFVKMIVGSNLGLNKYDGYSASECADIIAEASVMLSIEYMHRIAEKYDFDKESINIDVKGKKGNFLVEYDFDDRTDWRF